MLDTDCRCAVRPVFLGDLWMQRIVDEQSTQLIPGAFILPLLPLSLGILGFVFGSRHAYRNSGLLVTGAVGGIPLLAYYTAFELLALVVPYSGVFEFHTGGFFLRHTVIFGTGVGVLSFLTGIGFRGVVNGRESCQESQ